jgi:hypothetical protein
MLSKAVSRSRTASRSTFGSTNLARVKTPGNAQSFESLEDSELEEAMAVEEGREAVGGSRIAVSC